MNPLNPHRKSSKRPTPSASSHSPRSSSAFPPTGPSGSVGPSAASASSPAFPAFREPGRAVRGIAAVAALPLIPLLVFAGGDGFRAALDFTTGVLSLVALTASVMWGLVASDRLFLRPRQRLLAQAVHRATGAAAVGFLLLHGTVKLALDHVSLVGALVPFGLGVTGGDGLIGLGSLAGLLMVTTGFTGALRSAFASPVQVASRWRALHMLAYPAWCAALLHGLYAGRAPKPWVVALYCLCLVAVAGAVALRAAPRPVKREVAARIFALLEPDERPAPSRARHRERPTPARDTASTPLPGTSPSRFGTSCDQFPVSGIAAAYRALATPPSHDTALPPDLCPTEAPPTAAPRWPAPSPPPPAEAPSAPFPYASVDGGYASVDSGCASAGDGYALAEDGHASGGDGYSYGDGGLAPAFTAPYDTGPQPGHHPPRPGAPAHPPTPPPPPPPPPPGSPARAPAHGGAYADGTVGPVCPGDPATRRPLGPFQAPSTGEPWNATTGGSK